MITHSLSYSNASNQIFQLYRCISLKRVTSLWADLRAIAPAGNAVPFQELSHRWRAVGNIVCDLPGPRFEAQTSLSRGDRVIVRRTGRLF